MEFTAEDEHEEPQPRYRGPWVDRMNLASQQNGETDEEFANALTILASMGGILVENLTRPLKIEELSE